MPVSETEAWTRAVASADVDSAPIATIEINHPSFVENGTQVAVRLCSDIINRTFRIEAGAPLNAGQDVNFIAAPFEFTQPKKGADGAFEAKVRISNIGREISKYLDDAATISAEAKVTFRVYGSADPLNVAYGPVEYVLHEVDETDTEISATVRIADPANAKFGRLTYDMKNFASLLATS